MTSDRGDRLYGLFGLFEMVAKIALLAALVPVLLAALTGCGSDSDPPTTSEPGGPITMETDSDDGDRVEVVLGLYSGVPDPAWRLTTEQENDLAAALAALTRIDESAEAGGLGYHGFTIVTGDGTLIAFAGKVSSADADPPYVLDDPDRTIERLLLTTARAHVTAEELSVAAAAVDP
jgi:hypothetical protein